MKELLDQRKSTHGDFREQFACAQRIKEAFNEWGAYTHLSAIQREALDQIAHKQSRIITGDPEFADHWRDIAGYATIIADMLDGKLLQDKRDLAEFISNIPPTATPFIKEMERPY